MDRRMILYRGSLKSCNYHCSYCPFSKRPVSGRELEKDRGQWLSFIRTLGEKRWNVSALMVVPYGEAMLHRWYWEGLAQVSGMPEIEAVGIQTNLSFSGERFLACYAAAGGKREKLRLWATFHPEMTDVSEFAGRCELLTKAGVRMCAGAVGVPENLEIIRLLREKLPETVYLWINRMDGLGRSYTRAEAEAFQALDSYFGRELLLTEADSARCRNRLFVEGNGRLHTCNISPILRETWADTETFPAPVCRRRHCSCYLAYGGRQESVNDMLFGPWPLFRIPRHPRAVFLDIEGTLLQGGKLNGELLAGLRILAKEGTPLLFATTLPYAGAYARCREVWGLFRGGVFAGGAHLLLREQAGGEQEWAGVREYFYDLADFRGKYLADLKRMERSAGFRVLCCEQGGRCYKITLLRPAHRPWQQQEAESLFGKLGPGEAGGTGDRAGVWDGIPGMSAMEGVHWIVEKNCLQILPAGADKASGVKELCRWLDISPEQAFALGDSQEDVEMMQLCNR